MTADTFRIGARLVFPVSGPPLRDALVELRDGRIAGVRRREGDLVDLDVGDAAIVPGFVNAHTHLELGPLPEAGAHAGSVPEDQVAWLGRVIAARRAQAAEDAPAAVADHLARSLAAGTTALADITTAGASWPALAASPLRGTVHAELIGLRRERGLQTSRQAWEWLAGARREAASGTGRLRPGLSPHAPYSTAGWLYQWAAESRLPLATHLAELPAELELLRSRQGPLRRFLEDLGAWDPEWEPLGDRPAAYLRRGPLRQADWLVAHGTYFPEEDFWQFRPEAAPGGQRVAIVYCPRTHARFGHAPHPFRALLSRGAVVCVGTDSLASSPSLGVLDELRFLAEHVAPDLDGRVLLLMGTLLGAWALRLDEEVGSLAPGKAADLAIVALPDRDDADPYRLLFRSDRPVLATMIAGRFVAGPYAGPEDPSA
jgi:cytosine/adenosine deaminase-related metal-dependent hydrolase